MKIKKFCCFLIPELSNKYFLFLWFLIGALFRKCIPGILSDFVFKLNYDKINYEKEKTLKYFEIVSNIISDLLTGIIHLILIQKERNDSFKNNSNEIKEKNEHDKRIKRFSLIFNDETKKKSLCLKLIFIISYIDFICQLCLYFGCHINKNIIDSGKKLHSPDYLYSFLAIDIIARYEFSRLILKTYFYYHHYLSFFINIIILIILFIIDLIYKINEYNNYFLLIMFIQYILYSLEDIINKVALTKLFINPESLLFYKGIYSLVYFIIFTIFLIIFDDLKITFGFNLELLYFIITKIIFIFFNMIRSIFLVKVIDIFSSQHISFLKVLENIIISIYYFFDSIYKKKCGKNCENIDNYFHLETVDLIEINACLILLFSSLIHNEIIILDCHKFKKNTNFFLSIEADKENYKLLDKNIN